MNKREQLRQQISSVRWEYWVGSGGPIQLSFSLEPFGDGFRIGEGATDFERTWNLQRTANGLILTVWGDHGGPTFHASWNGEEFVGDWVDRRNCAVRLVPACLLSLDMTLPPEKTVPAVPFFVGIPTLRCYDLCRLAVDAVLESSLLPEAIYVVDNGSESVGFSHPHPLVSVIKARRNLGVARSWNLIHKLAAPHPIIYLNDDISVGKNCLEKLITADASMAVLNEMRAYEAFMVRQEIWDAIGDFDETFFPAYHEDNDHHRRITLAGFEAALPMNHGILQRGPSATVQRLTVEEKAEFSRHFDFCRQYYMRKWGGLPHQEIFTTPFNSGN